MRGRFGRASRATVSVKVLVSRISFALLLAVSVTLIILSRSKNAAVEQVRSAVVDVAAPVLDVLSRPVDAFHGFVDWTGDLMFLYDENQRVREENSRLLQWQAVARRLERENQRYRSLLKVRTERAVPFVTARIVADAGGSFVRAVLLGAGRRDGVTTGQAVVDAQGLVGHIVTVGHRSARALLLTDLNSHVPVTIESGDHRAILVGDNSALPRLDFLPVGSNVLPGDRVITSGDGGILPPGIPIGQVVAASGGTVRVKLNVDAERIEFVRVLAYKPPALDSQPPARPGAQPGAQPGARQ